MSNSIYKNRVINFKKKNFSCFFYIFRVEILIIVKINLYNVWNTLYNKVNF